MAIERWVSECASTTMDAAMDRERLAQVRYASANRRRRTAAKRKRYRCERGERVGGIEREKEREWE